MTTSPHTIRDATKQDASSIARLHTESWKIVYRGILPDTYLDNDLEAERIEHWQDKMNNLPSLDRVWVAETDGAIIGFIAIWLVEPGGPEALVCNLHVSPRHKGQGIGKALLASAAKWMITGSKTSCYLYVYDANLPAIRFYEKMGGQPDGKYIYNIAGIPIPETIFRWTDLEALADYNFPTPTPQHSAAYKND